MSKNGTLFIINLSKSPEGYTFQSFQEAENVPSKKKNTSKDKSKNSSNRTIHRISRQLGLDTQQPEVLFNPIPEESQPLPKIVEPQIQEQFSAQIKREKMPESPARWYNQSSIHEIEKQALPQFFNGKTYKTPGLYLKFRNFIVALYQKNPYQYLTKIACRRILRGDVNTIMKIHSFLQKQGVINFCISKQGNYSFSTSIFSRALNLQSKQGIAIDKIPETDQEKTAEPVDMTNITLTTVNKVFSKTARVFCHKCQSICGILWHKKIEESEKSYNICGECYQKLSEKEAQQYHKIDIVKKIESGGPDNKAVWSIEDNLKLLQFVSHPAKKWETLVNSFQKKKTFDDIMLQFMQFPIGNFDPSQTPPTQSLLDTPEFHINKLVQRINSSTYAQQDNEQQKIELNNKKFSEDMLKLTKNLCDKFSLNIKKNKKIQSDIQSGLFQINSYKTLGKKRIQNQQVEDRNSQKKIQEYQEENSLQSNQQEQYLQNQRENEENEINEGQQQIIKDDELEDFINNLTYN